MTLHSVTLGIAWQTGTIPGNRSLIVMRGEEQAELP
jgi:hypothetical protein